MVRIYALLSIFTLCSCYSKKISADDQQIEAAKGLITRLIPGYEDQFMFERIASQDGLDVFEIQNKNGKIFIRGNTGVSLARGVNHYLRNYCHASISWNGDNLNLPQKLPPVPETISISSPYKYRYYLNYCTYSYSMAFWDWARWEREIDWMALQGINLPLAAVVGQNGVWQNALLRLGYSTKEIEDFLPGPGYDAWWLMGNLEGAGGPITQAYIDSQVDLQKKIVDRMRLYGMEPAFQGFYGMVPVSMIAKKKEARIKDMGNWVTVYKRPALLDPTDPYFKEVASIYYEEQEKLFGKTKYFGGDPFHEGGISDSIDIQDAASKIVEAMHAANPEAVWILQGWQKNPSDALMKGLKSGQALILDLMACTRPQWGGVRESLFYKEKGHLHHDWIWTALPNFGGRIGMYGRIFNYAHDPIDAKNHPLGKNLKGIGTAPEGIGTNPVVYDMVYDMAWTSTPLEPNQWLTNYTRYRYGKSLNTINKAWNKLAMSVYDCPTQEDGPMESIFCARPQKEIKHVSAWGTAELYYNPKEVVEAWDVFLESRDSLRSIDTYQFDAVDITRQVLADYGKHVHKQMIKAFDDGNRQKFKILSSNFLDLIRDQDKLLSTRNEFLLGHWIADARRAGKTKAEGDQFEKNARTLLTTWADVDSDLHDYAHREWAGLLKDFYLPRWRLYIDSLSAELEGRKATPVDFFKFEQAWTREKDTYRSAPEGDAVEIAVSLHKKYYNELINLYASRP